MAAIVLLHAFPLDSRMWESQVEALSRAGHEVWAPDLLAPGMADSFEGPPSIDAMARWVLAESDRRGLHDFAVAGVSMGGYVAMALLREAGHRISGLALLDTKSGADSDAAARDREEFAVRVTGSGLDWVPEAMLDKLLGETTRETRPTVVRHVTDWILQSDPVMLAWAQRAMAVRPDAGPELDVFRQPTLVVVGTEDVISPPGEAAAMSEALGGAPLSMVSGAGHLANVECPGRVSEMLVSWADRLG